MASSTPGYWTFTATARPSRVIARCTWPIEAEAIGVKGADGETTLVAFVAGSPELDANQVRRAMNDRAPSYMVPRHVEILASLPRTASGKLDRPLLQAEAERLLTSE